VVTDPFASLPIEPVAPDDIEPRCWQCGAMLARIVSRPWIIDCHRCKARNQRGVPDGATAEDYGATPRRTLKPQPMRPRQVASG
jgi:phage FluMu protein Com